MRSVRVDIYTPLMRRGRSESARAGDVSRKYGGQIASILQHYCGSELDYWARCKRSALLWDWLGGTPVEVLERNYTVNPFQGLVSYGDVIKIADATRFHLRSAHQILSTLLTENPDFLRGLDTILKRLELGLPESALPLVDLPILLTRGQYLTLWQTGCRAPADVEQLSAERLAACVGPSVAGRLIHRAH
jgi:helicase